MLLGTYFKQRGKQLDGIVRLDIALGIALELGPLVLRHLLAASDRLEDVLDVTTVELVCQTANLEERLPRLGRLAGDLHNRLVGKHPFAGQVALLRLGLAPSGEFARDGKLTARKRGDALDPMPALTRIDIVAFQGGKRSEVAARTR